MTDFLLIWFQFDYHYHIPLITQRLIATHFGIDKQASSNENIFFAVKNIAAICEKVNSNKLVKSVYRHRMTVFRRRS